MLSNIMFCFRLRTIMSRKKNIKSDQRSSTYCLQVSIWSKLFISITGAAVFEVDNNFNKKWIPKHFRPFLEHRLTSFLDWDRPIQNLALNLNQNCQNFHSVQWASLKIFSYFSKFTSKFREKSKLQWYAGIRPPPYWCRNKTLFERPIVPPRENFWLWVAF